MRGILKFSHRARALLLAALVLVLGGTAQAQTLTLNLSSPTFDFWSYPFEGPYGARTSASTFTAVGSPDFDNRDGQFGLGFSSAGTIPTGLPIGNYRIISAVVNLQVTNSGKVFDPTYDPINTVNTTDGTRNANDDPGRPMELYGAGYRNGVTVATVGENTPFSTKGQPQAGTRSVYPTDFVASASLNPGARDVSNNVTGLILNPGGFEAEPFAIGQVAGLVSGNTIPADSIANFSLNLADPDVVRYLQLSLRQGLVVFMVNSLDKSGGQMDPAGTTIYATKEDIQGSLKPQFILQVEIIPEPSAITLLLCGTALFVACWRGGRAWREPSNLS